LEVTLQQQKNTPSNNLTRNYSTNDQMLRYRWIDDHFFMDTFFAAAKGGKSSQGNTCCQLFVVDKGFLYVGPLRKKAEALQAVKQFVKEIGAPKAIICDGAGEQSSHELKHFCEQIGTTLRHWEEGTPWDNRAELYIGILKQAVWTDMQVADSPVAFRDYCVC
jgi:hypothetical protein